MCVCVCVCVCVYSFGLVGEKRIFSKMRSQMVMFVQLFFFYEI